MQLNELKEKLTSKKILMMVIGVLVIIWLIRETMMWTYMHEFQRMFTQFNTQFDAQQKMIHQKIDDAESHFEKRQRAFDEGFERTGRAIEDARQEFKETMEILEKSALEREKKFDEVFAKGPDELLKQHKAMGDKMFHAFMRESQQRSDYFKKNVTDVDKTLEKTRCFMAIGERPTDLGAPLGLTPIQLEERRNNMMRIRMELAKSNDCEAYL